MDVVKSSENPASNEESSLNCAITLTDTILFNGNPLHIYGSHENPLFKATEVCPFLDLKNVPMAIARLDNDVKFSFQMKDVLGRTQQYTMVSEPGLYELILMSRKPVAKAFKRWVNHEVLPVLRKRGEYSMKRARDDDDCDRETKRRSRVTLCIEKEIGILQELGQFDDRDRINYADQVRSLAGPPNLITEGGEDISLSQWLVRNGYTRQATDLKLLSKIGRQLAPIYRRERGKEPPKRSQYVGGKPTDVFHYTAKDFELFEGTIRQMLKP